MITYNQCLDRLYQVITTQRSRFHLENAHALNRALSFPTSTYPTIHVAGSNGKGSVTTKIAKALECAGYRVGLYTSPHLFCFRERIAINSTLISEEEVVAGLEPLFSLVKEATFFELVTFLAFDYFRKKNVDVALIETGLGGRFDATNVIEPILTVITSISREHCQLLGEDLEQIAAEKAGILKPHIPVVIGPKARSQSIYQRAQELHCPLVASKKISYFFDEENSAVAQLALEQLSSHFSIDTQALQQGLAVRPACRFERHQDVIFDVAHNPDAVFYLLQALHTFFPERNLRFVVGFSKDKEYDLCLELIADVACHIHLVMAPMPRAASPHELQEALKNEDPDLSTTHCSIQEGVTEAHAVAQAKGEILVVCGSFYIMAEAKQALQAEETLGWNEITFGIPPALSSSVI